MRALRAFLGHPTKSPAIISSKKFERAYIETFLNEEILEEGLARNLPVFADFLYSAEYRRFPIRLARAPSPNARTKPPVDMTLFYVNRSEGGFPA